MKDYKLVIRSNANDLATEIREMFRNGWVCLNGGSVQPNPEIKNGFWYIQTMILK
jgi:hypothetical protein